MFIVIGRGLIMLVIDCFEFPTKLSDDDELGVTSASHLHRATNIGRSLPVTATERPCQYFIRDSYTAQRPCAWLAM